MTLERPRSRSEPAAQVDCRRSDTRESRNLLHPERVRNLLSEVAAGRTSVEDALARLSTLPYEDLRFARLDHHRELRTGFPEVIFGLGKTDEQIERIFARLRDSGANVLATRISAETASALAGRLPGAAYDPIARTLSLRQRPRAQRSGLVTIICAGTADLPVAEEARVTAELSDANVETIYDVGVAGLHRLLAEAEALRRADVLVVVAGMEGALPSVVAGLVAAPVIATPTSVGYGAHFGGVAPLLAMLNCCAAGVAVVNIDNGFGAGRLAAMIARLVDRDRGGAGATPP